MKLTGLSDDYAIFGFIFSLSNRIQTLIDKECEYITMKQQFMMIALSMCDHAPSLKEMADLIGCSYQNIKRMSETLQKEGYLNIVQDTKDKRKQLLVSTGKMEQIVNIESDKRQAFMSKLFENISNEDLFTTLKTLMKMDHNIGGTVE